MEKLPIVFNIKEYTVKNDNFRHVVYTYQNSQLVVMSLLQGEDIGMEVHSVDQFLRIEKGTGKVNINGYSFNISDGFSIGVPAGASHNITNTGMDKMKLYTIYSPPNEPKNLTQPYKL